MLAPHPSAEGDPARSRGERPTILVREAPPVEEAHAARVGRLLLAAGAVINHVRNLARRRLAERPVTTPCLTILGGTPSD